MQRTVIATTLCVLASAGCLLESSVVSAQACCVGGGGQLGIVGRERRAALSLALGYQRALGSASEDGGYRGLRGASVDDVSLDLGGGVRFLDHRVELSGTLPLRLQHRSFSGSAGSTRAGPGDASIGLAVMAIRGRLEGMHLGDPATFTPFLDLSFGVTLPTGRAPEDSRDQNGADVMGGGHYTWQAGLRLSQFVRLNQIVTLTANVERASARGVQSLAGDAHRYRPGDALNLRLIWLYARDLIWSGGVFTSARFQGRATEDGGRVPNSGSRRVRLGGLLSWVFDLPDWEATFTLTLDAFFDGLDDNVPQLGPRADVMIRRSF